MTATLFLWDVVEDDIALFASIISCRRRSGRGGTCSSRVTHEGHSSCVCYRIGRTVFRKSLVVVLLVLASSKS